MLIVEPDKYKSFQRLEADPKSYVISVVGIKLDPTLVMTIVPMLAVAEPPEIVETRSVPMLEVVHCIVPMLAVPDPAEIVETSNVPVVIIELAKFALEISV
jgi:hypothetical protein